MPMQRLFGMTINTKYLQIVPLIVGGVAINMMQMQKTR